MAEIDYAKRPDLHPSFWPKYQEPSKLARAIQMPMYPFERWANGVLNAHIARPDTLREIARGETEGRGDA